MKRLKRISHKINLPKAQVDKCKRIGFHVLKKIWVMLAAFIVVAAITFSIVRALTPWVKQYKTQVEHQLSTFVGQPVTIGGLETGWYWFQPVLKMQTVQLSDDQNRHLVFNQLRVGINLWHSLWSWQIKPGVLYASDGSIVLHQTSDTAWDIEGLQVNHAQASVNQSNYIPLAGWLLTQDTIILKNMTLTIHLQNGGILPLRHVSGKVKSSGGHVKLSLYAELAENNPTALTFVANLNINQAKPMAFSGQMYLALEHFLPKQWQGLVPGLPVEVSQGECDLKAWFDLQEGHLTNVQSEVHVNQLIWTMAKESTPRRVEAFSGNIAWKKVAQSGWHLSADHVQLSLNGVDWPENALQLDYQSSDDIYTLFVKKVLLDSLFAIDLPWPDKMKPFIAQHPQGELSDTQVTIQNHQLSYILTRFSNLNWQSTPTIPAMTNLSGALYWEPNEGRLMLDGEKTTISPNALPPFTFDLFNADIDWKALSNGYRVSMDRFVLTHPNLTVSASGILDNPQTPEARLQLTAAFSAENAKQLMVYFPHNLVKAKLETWLREDIKRVKRASGRVVVEGKLRDFPFDNQKGTFSIVSHLSGVDLLISPEWPMNQNIDADLIVDKRSLVANIDEAILKGVMLNRVNLAIHHIGLGQEALLIHGQVDAPGEQIKRYIFASPLRNRLARWRAIGVPDDLSLDLHLDIPLYPESDHVAVLGKLNFNQNKVIVHFPIAALTADDVKGQLQFNEYGLTDGELRGLFGGSPVSLRAQALIEPKAGTLLTIEGETDLDYLQKTLSLPWLKLMSGRLSAAALWTIYPDDIDPDELHIDSSLKEVHIDLPKPLGKAAGVTAPLTMDVHFEPKDAMQIQLDYDHQLQSLLWLKPVDNHFALERGQVHIGPGNLAPLETKGLYISGVLPEVDLSNWRKTWLTLSQDKTQSMPLTAVNNISLKIGEMHFLNQKYTDLQFRARPVSADDWAFNILEANVAGSLHYFPSKHLLSGELTRLYLYQPKQILPLKSHEPQWRARPNDIPNVSLTINALKIHDVEVGNVRIKGSTTPTDWSLDECVVATPEYQLHLDGVWQALTPEDRTTLEARLEMNNLGKSLERWHLKPAVQAHKGYMHFKGGWKGPAYDFALNRLNGNMDLLLKNGRISHFDKETEEKLGLGKLLSILSLQTIPRRLQLDFSDLAEDGYSFDIFKGSFQINQGVMTTHDSYIDGPVAFAKMNGDLDLSKKLYDINLRITPYITASLPVVATIAGGPIAGVATWVASNIINKGMQQISGYSYKISGPWLDPVVQQVSIERK